ARIGSAASLEEPRVDHAGNDDADVDTGSGGLGPQAFGERVETCLGRRVDGFTGDTGAAGDRRHEADRAVLPVDHAGQQCVGEFDCGQQIDLDESPNHVDSHGRHTSEIAEAGVVHQHVD